MKKCNGFTLIEVLVTLAILSSFTAHNTTINYGKTVTLCPIANMTCSGNWQNELTVFYDPNNNKKIRRRRAGFNNKGFYQPRR